MRSPALHCLFNWCRIKQSCVCPGGQTWALWKRILLFLPLHAFYPHFAAPEWILIAPLTSPPPDALHSALGGGQPSFDKRRPIAASGRVCSIAGANCLQTSLWHVYNRCTFFWIGVPKTLVLKPLDKIKNILIVIGEILGEGMEYYQMYFVILCLQGL